MDTVDREKILDEFLYRLQSLRSNQDDKLKLGDIDLAFRFIELYLANPKHYGSSSKLQEFEIERDNVGLLTRYRVVWRRFDKELVR